MIPSDDSIDAKEESESESGKPHHDTREDHPTTNTDKFFKKTFKEHPQRFSAFFAGCAVFISIVALFFSYKQMENSGISAEAAKQSALNAAKSIEIAETSTRISNRAYLNVSKIEIRENNIANFKIRVFFKNAGRTPAYKLRSTSILKFQGGLPDTVVFTKSQIDTVRKLILLGSGDVTSVDIEFEQKPSRIEIDQIKNRKLFIVCAGRVTYFDIFKTERFLHYCAWLKIESDGKGSFVYCPKYNDAD